MNAERRDLNDCAKLVQKAWIVRGVKLAFLASLLLGWELVSRYGAVRAELLPPPSQLVSFAREMASRKETAIDIVDSLRRVAVGFGLASTAAIILAVVFSYLRPMRPFIELVVDLVRPIPPIAWIPLAILFFGIGDMPAYFIVFLASFFPIFVNVSAGLTSIDPHLLMVARSLGAKHRHIYLRVQLPSLLPYLFAGMKTGLGIGWMAVITAEMVGSQTGLGYRIQLSRLTLQIENVILGMVVIGTLGYLLGALLTHVERRLTPWTVRENP